MVFCEFIERWPNLSKLKGAREETLKTFFKSHHSGREDLMNRRIELIHRAISLTDDIAVIEPYQQYLLGLINLLKSHLETIKEYDTKTAAIFKQHEDFPIFASFPGAGPQLAPRLLTAFGSDRSVFSCAEEVQRCSGIAPVMVLSGKKSLVHWRFRCHKFFGKRS